MFYIRSNADKLLLPLCGFTIYLGAFLFMLSVYLWIR